MMTTTTTTPVDDAALMMTADDDDETATETAANKTPSRCCCCWQQEQGRRRRRRPRWILPVAIGGGTVVLLVIIILSTTIVLMSPKSTVCGPNLAGGSVEGFDNCYFSFLDWDTGCTYVDEDGKSRPNALTLKILIFDDDGSNNYYSRSDQCHSSTETDYSICHGWVTNQDQQVTLYEYTIMTYRNQTVEFSIDGISYDFWQGGALFLIQTSSNDNDNNNNANGDNSRGGGGKAVVTQIEADLRNVGVNYDDDGGSLFQVIENFALSNEQISTFCSM
jgi:hypothetical protein